MSASVVERVEEAQARAAQALAEAVAAADIAAEQPSAKTVTAKLLAEQIAINAKADAERVVREAQPELAEQRRAAMVAKRERLEAELNIDPMAEHEAHVMACVEALKAALGAYAGALENLDTRAIQARTYAQLSEELGLPVSIRILSPEDTFARMRARIGDCRTWVHDGKRAVVATVRGDQQ